MKSLVSLAAAAVFFSVTAPAIADEPGPTTPATTEEQELADLQQQKALAEARKAIAEAEKAEAEALAAAQKAKYPVSEVTAPNGNFTVTEGNAPLATRVAQRAVHEAARLVADEIKLDLKDKTAILINTYEEIPPIAKILLAKEEHKNLAKGLTEARAVLVAQLGLGDNAGADLPGQLGAAQSIVSQAAKLVGYFRASTAMTVKDQIIADGEHAVTAMAEQLKGSAKQLVIPAFAQAGTGTFIDELAKSRAGRDELNALLTDKVPDANKAYEQEKKKFAKNKDELERIEANIVTLKKLTEEATKAIAAYDAWWKAMIASADNKPSLLDYAVAHDGLAGTIGNNDVVIVKVNAPTTVGGQLVKQWLWSNAKVVLVGTASMQAVVTDTHGVVLVAATRAAECRMGFKSSPMFKAVPGILCAAP